MADQKKAPDAKLKDKDKDENKKIETTESKIEQPATGEQTMMDKNEQKQPEKTPAALPPAQEENENEDEDEENENEE